MTYNKELIAGKLRRWEKYLDDYRLPAWEEIPDIGLYMDQVVTLVTGYLDYMPPELKEEQVITPAAINNYVRKKIIPEPVKKKYYRSHIACLIMVCTLKQSLSIPTLKTMIPMGLDRGQVEEVYRSYARQHAISARAFTEQIRQTAAPILEHEDADDAAAESTEALVTRAAITGGFYRLLSEKLILLEEKTPDPAQ